MAGQDADLNRFSRDQLIAEVVRLRAGIRAHRDSSLDDLCWHHPQMWGLLPEQTDPQPKVPAWPRFMEGCIRYRQSLDEHGHVPSPPVWRVKSAMKIASAVPTQIAEISQNRMMTVVSGQPVS